MMTFIGSLLVDISIIYLLFIFFSLGRKTTKYLYRRFFYKNDDVPVRLKMKDGTTKEYLLDRETAETLLQSAKDSPI